MSYLPYNTKRALLTSIYASMGGGGQGQGVAGGSPGGGSPDYSGPFQGGTPLDRWNSFMKELGGGVSVTSGYRSVAEQQAIWDRTDPSRRGTWVARPGSSYHNKMIGGLPGAQDLGFASADVRNRFVNLAPKYGFYQPMPYESWHWEPTETRGMRGR